MDLYHVFFCFRGILYIYICIYIYIYIDKGTFEVRIPMFEKKLQHEDSHELPRILTIWSYKICLSIFPYIFDSQETLTLVTILPQSSKLVYFPADVAKPVHRFCYFPQLYNVYWRDSLEYYHWMIL